MFLGVCSSTCSDPFNALSTIDDLEDRSRGCLAVLLPLHSYAVLFPLEWRTPRSSTSPGIADILVEQKNTHTTQSCLPILSGVLSIFSCPQPTLVPLRISSYFCVLSVFFLFARCTVHYSRMFLAGLAFWDAEYTYTLRRLLRVLTITSCSHTYFFACSV